LRVRPLVFGPTLAGGGRARGIFTGIRPEKKPLTRIRVDYRGASGDRANSMRERFSFFVHLLMGLGQSRATIAIRNV